MAFGNSVSTPLSLGHNMKNGLTAWTGIFDFCFQRPKKSSLTTLCK